MWKLLCWSVVGVLLWPGAVKGAACPDFPWQYPPDMTMPDVVRHGQELMESQQLLEARVAFVDYLTNNPEGIFAEGARWALAFLPEESPEPDQEFLRRIKRLQAIRAQHPHSPYAPWALCAMGDIYWSQQWYAEANAQYEEFLDEYPEHPLAGGVMIEAGTGFLENQKYLEAALIFRRVVEEPQWDGFRMQGARGLADATALSRAWKQADYWYQVVEAEGPELLRRSVRSSYHFGVTELALGHQEKAKTWLLTTINNHPHTSEAGQAWNHLAEHYVDQGHPFVGLWFAEQAKLQFPHHEVGRRARVIQNRWVLDFLSQEPTSEQWEYLYRRLEELEIFLSVSWDQGLETARSLSQAPEGDIAEESTLWMGKGYEALGDIPAAIKAYEKVVVLGDTAQWIQDARARLTTMLTRQIQEMYNTKSWLKLLKFHSDHQSAFRVIPLERARAMMMAKAFEQVNLPAEAIRWYDQLLDQYPDTPLREEILARKVLLAEGQGKNDWILSFGQSYLAEFPEGRWRGPVETAVGMVALKHNQFEQAITSFSRVLPYLRSPDEQRYVLRHRAQAFQRHGRMGQAQKDFEGLLRLKPVHVTDYLRFADFLYDRGDYEEAQPLYETVLSEDSPTALKAWGKYRLGLSLEHMGNYQAAQKVLGELQQLESQPPEFEHTIRAAATAVIEEFSLKQKPWIEREYEAS